MLLPLGQVLAEPAQFNDKGEVLRPADYREWVFLTSGLGMTYGPNAARPGQPAPFSNVFVNPESYRAFMQTGRWPNGTMFVMPIAHPSSVSAAAVTAPSMGPALGR